MPIRFRRTFKIFPGVKINISKGGFSVTVGPRGAALNFSKRGVRQTLGIPGSGLSESSYLFKKDDDDDKDSNKDERERRRDNDDDDDGVGCFPWGWLTFLVIVAVGGYFVADAFHWIPQNYLSHLMEQITRWARDAGL